MRRGREVVGASHIFAQTGMQLALVDALTDRLDTILATGEREEREDARERAAMLRRIVQQLKMTVVLVEARANPLSSPRFVEEMSKYFRVMVALKQYEIGAMNSESASLVLAVDRSRSTPNSTAIRTALLEESRE